MLHLEPARKAVCCLSCGTPSARKHSHYQRMPWDLPWGRWPVQLVVYARRFFCDEPGCPRRIFSEPFPGVLPRYARHTERLRLVLLELSHASGAEMAARVARWLSVHPGIEVVARDRAGACALAAATEAPQAVQVADRFHLVRNISDALKELVRSRRWNRPRPAAEAASAPEEDQASLPAASTAAPGREPQPTPTKKARWEAVRERRERGQSLVAIAQELDVDHRTVRRYLGCDQPPVYPLRHPWPSPVIPYLSYLRQRWSEGCRNIRQLYRGIVQQDYNGSERQVRWALRHWRSAQGPPPPSPLHWLVLRPSRRLTPSEREDLERILEANPALALGYRLKERFHHLVAHRDVAELDRWLDEAAHCDLPTFKALARTIHQDYQAVKAAITLPWSIAQCEGQNTRVKLIKRLGYGRAKLDLLRTRILHRMPTV